MRRRLPALLTAAVVTLATLSAVAQDAPSADDVKAAAEAFDKGREAFRKREFTEAAEHFEAADDRAPSAAVIELAIRARDKAGQLDRAATLAAMAVQRHPGEDKVVKLAEGILARAKKQFFALVARCDTPCALLVDGKIIHGAPATERTVFLPAGEHPVVASWSEGRTEKQSAAATAGGTGELSFKAPPLPEPEPPPPPPPPATTAAPPPPPPPPPEAAGLPPLVFWIGAGTTVLLSGITVWSGIDTQNNPGPDRVRAACDAGDVARCNSLYDDGTSAETRTNVLLGVTAGVAVITGIVGAFATDWGATEEAPPAAARRSPSPSWEPIVGLGQGATLGARGRF